MKLTPSLVKLILNCNRSINKFQSFETPTKPGVNGISGGLSNARTASTTGLLTGNSFGMAKPPPPRPPQQNNSESMRAGSVLNGTNGQGSNWSNGNKYGPSFMGSIAKPPPQVSASRSSPTSINSAPQQAEKQADNKSLPPVTNNAPPEQPSVTMQGGHAPPVGFFSGRAVKDLPEGETTIVHNMAFDPRRPTSLPRTAGIDHSTSSPVKRKIVDLSTTNRPNFANPSQQAHRQIGLPPGRSPYRPPSMAPPGNGFNGLKRGPDQVDQTYVPIYLLLSDIVHIR